MQYFMEFLILYFYIGHHGYNCTDKTDFRQISCMHRTTQIIQQLSHHVFVMYACIIHVAL